MDTVNPQVSQNIKPKEGMMFSTIEDAFEFYNSYAKEAGFGTRKSSAKGQGDAIHWQQFVCYKEGLRSDSKRKVSSDGVSASTLERNRGIVRTSCKARMTVSKRKNATHFSIISFEESHNHELATPKKTHFLASHRNVSKAKKILADQLTDADFSASQQMKLFSVEAGGIQNVGCTERDLRNHIRDQRKKSIGVDASILYDYFTFQQQKDPSFYFSFDKDEDDRMTRCFWADSESRLAYKSFGDVVVFDTTYNTNKYSMIFAPIFGINQHTQTNFFGCGFLSDETTESFIWFFEQFKQSMLKGPPQLIITDQDPAMTKAITISLPTTFHRYCIWHITNKFQEKLGPLNFHNFYRLFQSSIYNSDTEQEFEYSWRDALNQSSLHDHVWLQSVYDIRHRWVPAYVNHIFSAGCSSSQRAESGHSFFKKYVAKENSLMDFVTRYTYALDYQRDKELNEDWSNINEKPQLNSLFPMEKQMAGIYSRKIFLKFQKELSESFGYNSTSNQDVYVVFRVEADSSKPHQLVYDRSTDFLRCSCRLFEFRGIPCRHMLHYFFVSRFMYLPEQYILHRWRKNAKLGGECDDTSATTSDMSGKSLLQKRTQISQRFSHILDDAIISEQGTEIIERVVDDLDKRIKQVSLTRDHFGAPSMTTPQEEPNIFDPRHVRAKGCGRRLKTGREKAIRKGRLCHGCGLRDQSHDKRNCPMLIGRNNDDLSEDSSSASEQDDLSPAHY